MLIYVQHFLIILLVHVNFPKSLSHKYTQLVWIHERTHLRCKSIRSIGSAKLFQKRYELKSSRYETRFR